MKTNKKCPAEFILPLIINGLRGRVLKLKSVKKGPKREILLIYGLHSSLERMFPIAEQLTNYGNVTLPDLPGFGGMDSLYKIGERPSLDNLADYLATLIMLNYKNKPITIGAMSFGFVIVTRMLQKHPELVDQVDLLVSFVGFSHKDDFKFSKRIVWWFKNSTGLFRRQLPAAFLKYIILRAPLIRLSYLLFDVGDKMKDVDKKERNRRIKFEIGLWKSNDIRTYMDTVHTMLDIDLTTKKVGIPIINITVGLDQYFNGKAVSKHLKKIFPSVKEFRAHLRRHAPTIITTSEEINALFTKELKKELSRIPKR